MPDPSETFSMSMLSVAELDAGTPDAADVASLQRQLLEKEQLVVALTDRLEQLAEQLDRLRRTGADRGNRRGSGGGVMPLELIEDHRAAIEDLKQAVTRWEEMQAAATLGRLETQVSELRDLVVNFAQGAPSAGEPHTAGHAESKPASPSWWEQQKASMLGEGTTSQTAETPEGIPPTDSPPLGNVAELELPQLPAAIDFDSLTLDAARDAIRERDAVIARLHEPLLLAQATALIPRDAKTWEQVPEALRERFAALDTHWQARFRKLELDLSLERARLSREEAALRQQKEQLGQEVARLGTQRDKSSQGESDTAEDDTPRRRWFRFLTPAGEEEDDE